MRVVIYGNRLEPHDDDDDGNDSSIKQIHDRDHKQGTSADAQRRTSEESRPQARECACEDARAGKPAHVDSSRNPPLRPEGTLEGGFRFSSKAIF